MFGQVRINVFLTETLTGNVYNTVSIPPIVYSIYVIISNFNFSGGTEIYYCNFKYMYLPGQIEQCMCLVITRLCLIQKDPLTKR